MSHDVESDVLRGGDKVWEGDKKEELIKVQSLRDAKQTTYIDFELTRKDRWDREINSSVN